MNPLGDFHRGVHFVYISSEKSAKRVLYEGKGKLDWVPLLPEYLHDRTNFYKLTTKNYNKKKELQKK
jgi:hypothetical protein